MRSILQHLSMHTQYPVVEPRHYCLNSPHCFLLYSPVLAYYYYPTEIASPSILKALTAVWWQRTVEKLVMRSISPDGHCPPLPRSEIEMLKKKKKNFNRGGSIFCFQSKFGGSFLPLCKQHLRYVVYNYAQGALFLSVTHAHLYAKGAPRASR